MPLSQAAQAAAEALGRSLAPPTPEEGAQLAVIFVSEPPDEAAA